MLYRLSYCRIEGCRRRLWASATCGVNFYRRFRCRLVEHAREVELREFEVLSSALCHRRIKLDGLTEAGCERLAVVGACAHYGHQIICGGVGSGDSCQSRLSLAVVLGEDLCESGVVGLAVAECLHGCCGVALLEVVYSESVAKLVEAGGIAEVAVGGVVVGCLLHIYEPTRQEAMWVGGGGV